MLQGINSTVNVASDKGILISTGVRAITVATNANGVSILHNQISGAGYGIHFGNATYANVKINSNQVVRRPE